MHSYNNKIKLLVFVFFILILSFYSQKTYAYSGQGQPAAGNAGNCQQFQCKVPGSSYDNWGSKQLCKYDDSTQPGLVGYQTNYYSSSDCDGGTCDGTFGFCPAQCDPNDANACGGGVCANGGASVSQVCSGNAKNPPTWCLGAICGTKCKGSTSGSFICASVLPGDTANVGGSCSTTTCHANNCISNSTANYQCVSGGCPTGWTSVAASSGTSCGFDSTQSCCSRAYTCTTQNGSNTNYTCINGFSCPLGYSRSTIGLTCAPNQTCCFPSSPPGSTTCTWDECSGACGGGRGTQDYICGGSITQTRNCTNNNPCPPPAPPIYTCSGNASNSNPYSCYASCPANYSRDFSKTCSSGVCCYNG